MNNIVKRQNEAEALALLRASERCLRIERILKYLMIFLSFGICLAAILNKYLPQILVKVANVAEIQQRAATYINLISGAIIVAGLPIGFYSGRMHTEGTVLRDRYDAAVFDNTPNAAILRPISQSFIAVYSKKLRAPDSEFKNFLFSAQDNPNEANAQFEYIDREVRYDYNLYLSVQPFFTTIWIGFVVLIIIIAVTFNDMFITTLINIMIPSLSAISTICNSWYNFRLQMRQLNNLVNVIDKINSLPPEKKKKYIADKKNMRLLADGLFNYRNSSFVIPSFLLKHHQKVAAKAKTAPVEDLTLATEESEKPVEQNVNKEKPVNEAKPAEASKPTVTKQQPKPPVAKPAQPKPSNKPKPAENKPNAKKPTASKPSNTQKPAANGTAKKKPAQRTTPAKPAAKKPAAKPKNGNGNGNKN